jgi:polysaccharide deacetylase family protein (PEP-CTERM system associated)
MSKSKGIVGVIFVLAVALNYWLLRWGATGDVFAGLTFATVCLSVSCILPHRGRESAGSEKDEAPARMVVRNTSESMPRRVPVGQIVNAFTIDLEDYFHTEVSSRDVNYAQWDKMPSRIECSVHRLLDLLDEHHAQATVFVLGWVAQKYPRLIREVATRGHEIACHSYRHRMVNKLTPRVFLEDTRMAKQIIEDVIGQGIEGYRAPSFSITPGTEWAFPILDYLGFTYDSSVHPVWHATYANTSAPRFPYLAGGTSVLEIPIATWRVGGVNLPVGGGAYLRLLPYEYIRRGLSSVNQREGQPVTLYVHPWEIDYLQPAIHSDWTSHARQIWGTQTMESKLHRLLSASRFASIASVYAPNLAHGAPVYSPSAERVPSLAQVS